MAEQIKIFNRKLGYIKGQVTRLNSLLLNEEQLEHSDILLKVSTIEKLKEKIDDLRNESYSELSDDDLKTFEPSLDMQQSDLETLEVKFSKLTFSVTDRVSVPPAIASVSPAIASNVCNLKLPLLNLPKFSGSSNIEWLNFSDLFWASVGQNNDISPAQKLQYLRTYLTDNALKVIQSLTITDDNFNIAWELLKERYSNKRELVFSLLDKLHAMPRLNAENAQKILEIVDTTKLICRSLNGLKIPVEGFSESIFVYTIIQKLDPSTKMWFDRSLTDDQLPELDKLLKFLVNHSKTLQQGSNANTKQSNNYRETPKYKSLVVKSDFKSNCSLGCADSHAMYKCKKFIAMNVYERFEYVKKNQLCFRCLSKHLISECPKAFLKCRFCECNSHNSLIHDAKLGQRKKGNDLESKIEASNLSNDSNLKGSSPEDLCFFSGTPKNNVLLSTAKVRIKGLNGEWIEVISLLDSGSQRNIIRGDLVKLLKLKRHAYKANLVGLKNTVVNVNGKVKTQISNDEGTFTKNLEFLVLHEIAGKTPPERIDISHLNLPTNIKYANPKFYVPQEISIILGGETFYELFLGNQIRVPRSTVSLIETVFGFVATGCLRDREQTSDNSFCYFVRDSIDDELKQFWQLEAIGILPDNNVDEKDTALSLFKESVTYENGKYSVGLPWKRDYSELNDNLAIARGRLNHLTRNFVRNPELYYDYKNILTDYEKEEIIEKVPNNEVVCDGPLYYMPFSMVYRNSVSSSKRMVFDASSHSDNELSLNDCLFTGQSLNPLLFNMLIFFRLDRVVVLADIRKAFLQICLQKPDRNAVRFLFPTANPGEQQQYDIEVFRFCRVLFGVNASPFLLSATIKEHIEKYRDIFPTTVDMLDTCLYVDDWVCSFDNVSSAIRVSREAKDIMTEANMNLCKWSSNSDELVQLWKNNDFQIHPIHSEDTCESDKLHKVLGLPWHVQQDYITLDVTQLLDFDEKSSVTKRLVLSTSGKIFDVLGLVTPYTIRLKCLFQELWLRKISWDDELPVDLLQTFIQWRSELFYFTNLRVPRNVLNGSLESANDLQLHIFCDASQKAYGAAAYLRVKNGDHLTVNLIASKSRVSPLSSPSTISLPRLELLGALLAARLGREVLQVIQRKGTPSVHFWTDSQITLFWIQGPYHKWKQFVANRVKEIQTLTDPQSWSHIPGKLNIADLLTRGSSAKDLIQNDLWWHGPEFLRNDENLNFECTNSVPDEVYTSELKRGFQVETGDMCFSIVDQSNFLDDCLLKITNSFCKLVRIVSHVFRFIYNCRNSMGKKNGYLGFQEIQDAETFILKCAQQEFNKELVALQKGEHVSSKSKLSSLNCFLDKNGVLRVGGRLSNSSVNENVKHPIVLPQKHQLTKMIVIYFHLKYLHVGPQTLLYLIRQKYWPLNGRNLCRLVVHECVTCTKVKPIMQQQLMGQLPKERVEPSPIFAVCGVDLAGPFNIQFKGQRKGVLNKIYVVIYVCFSTKAIHLDFVTDLTSRGFISSLKRFFSRRGKPSKIFSDNGRNFVGTNAELKRLLKLVNTPDEPLAKYFSEEHIDWHFNPPKSPNFGGLYEAGVKSFKFHLKRIASNSNLTLEEFLTVLAEIEGVLNSRPLIPLSGEFDNFETLTPGHFIIGRPITSIVEPQLADINDNRLTRWERVSKVSQNIWKLWKRDYLNNLQQRSKWKFEKGNVSVGSLVVIKEENLPGNKWLTGRIERIHAGGDGKVRIIDVKLPQGNILQRNVRNVCVLPVK